MKTGIASSVLVEQVRNTAAWLWSLPQAAAVTALFDAATDADNAEDASAHVATFRLRLAAHYATVATFVPTDVDAHIRHHAWMAIDAPDTFAAARGCIDEAAARDAALVSARVTLGSSGHDGEWLSVRAGALGRALMLGFEDEGQALAERIDAELEREERSFGDALASGAPARVTLALATTLAHNLGDLSRVVDAWPKALAEHEIKRRFSRLGHADAPVRRPAFVLAGVLNKELMALENHRFLALRKPRGLRRSRELLLPLGPWFDAWGELVGATPRLTDDERGEVVTALVELHRWSPEQEGCLRALAGIHRVTRGGLPAYLAMLPARLRKDAMRGRVREAIDVRPEHFETRVEKRFRATLARLVPPAALGRRGAG